MFDTQDLLHAAYLQTMFSLSWQVPVAYPRQLQITQGLLSWSVFRKCSSTASAVSENYIENTFTGKHFISASVTTSYMGIIVERWKE